ncbi:MAG TPA: TraB/GumN family protein [Bacteroidia bacterium]|nr:TraB/GumN family protein [Bacteroidia bacterium]
MKMIKTLALLLTSLLFIQGFSQSPDKKNKKDKKKDKKDTEVSTQTWLWEISGNGLKQPSYLYGTIHILCPIDFKISDSLKSKLEKSQQLVLEVVDADNPMHMVTFMESFMMEGKKLKDFYTEKEYEEIRKFFNDSVGVDVNMYGMMSPMFFIIATLPKMIGCEFPKSYEVELTKLARAQGKEVKEVETLEGQLSLFDTIPEHIQAKELLRVVREWNKEKQTFNGLVQMYRSQDFDKSVAFMHAHMGNMVEYKDILLDNRNQEWIAKIKTMAAEKPTLFAFGAGHLGGDKGLVELLKKEGYTLTPVKNELEN